MIKDLVFKTIILLCALIVGSSSAWSIETTIELNATNLGLLKGGYPDNEETVTIGGVTYKFNKLYKNDYSQILVKATDGNIYNSTPFSRNIKSVVITHASNAQPATIQGSTDGATWNDVATGTGSFTANFASYSYNYFKIVNGANFACWEKIEIICGETNITAVSNNDSWGTVELFGNVITATPNSGYRVSKTTPYEITSGEGNVSNISQDGNSFTVTTTGECTITINFEAIPTHTAKFSINGIIDNSNNVIIEENGIVTFPATPASLGGKAFVGWTISAISGTTDTAPATLIKATTTLMGENDITYYTVYATSTEGSLTDVLDYTFTGVSIGGYDNFSDKQAENGSSAVYAGNCATYENAIQLRSNSSSGIVSTISGGKLKKVTVDWGGDFPRTLNIYGKNTAYTSAADLYDSSEQGTLLGTIVKGTSTELIIGGDYEYIGIRSNANTLLCNIISIEWETSEAVYSAYCTTVSVTTPVITSDGWATYVTPYALRFAEDDAYIVNATGNKVVFLESVTDVPASTPVILKGEGAKTATVLTTADAITNNKLAVSNGSITDCYVLAKKDDKVGFYKWNGNNSHDALSAGRVYLPTSVVTSAHEFLGLNLGEETGMSEVRGKRAEGKGEVYDLQGRKVLKPTQGLYIVNGKRVAVK